jgi:hypothetical protein
VGCGFCVSPSAPRSVRSLGNVRGEEGGGKAGSGREERHEERAGEKEEARQGAARSRWGAPSCRAGFGVSASFIVGFVRVVIVGQEWLRQVQQSSRTNPTMKEAETPKPARQEGAPHLDLAAPCLASSFSPARSSCRSSRPLPALPPPSSPRTLPSERTERGAEGDTQNPQPTAVYWLLFWPLYAPQ